jgi:hypothetical protein
MTRSIEAQARSQRWKLQQAMEDVENRIALLRRGLRPSIKAKQRKLASHATLRHSRTGWNFRPRKPLRGFKEPVCTNLRKEGAVPCYKSHWVG